MIISKILFMIYKHNFEIHVVSFLIYLFLLLLIQFEIKLCYNKAITQLYIVISFDFTCIYSQVKTTTILGWI